MTSILLFLLQMLVLSVYAPLNKIVHGGWKPITKLDTLVPYWPYFVYPYLAAYIWIPMLYGLYMFRPIHEQVQLTIATVIACGIGYVCFYFFPTYVTCTKPTGSSRTYKLLQFLHTVDSENNACPSMHVYLAVLLGYFSWTSIGLVNVVVAGMAAAIAVSTVLIKRHYVLDVLGGMLVGGIAIVGSNFLV